jgi:hypothetical protein
MMVIKMIKIIITILIITLLVFTINLHAKVIVVNSTADSGPGSLRQALLDASTDDEIEFNTNIFPIGSPGVIYLNSPLPTIAQGNISINAFNAGVILDGSNIDENVNGLNIVSKENRISGLKIRGFYNGINLESEGSINMIGGINYGEENTIYNNKNTGILVGDNTVSNFLISNIIYGNGNLRIDLGNDGVTPNDPSDPDSGANNLQNFPVIIAANMDESDALNFLHIKYQVDSDPQYSTYPLYIQFFHGNNSSPPVPSYDGYYYIDDDYTEDDYNYGFKELRYGMASELNFNIGDSIVCTATDFFWGTSEFSSVAVIQSITSISNEYFPDQLRLYQNYPNPFNSETMIPFSISVPNNVSLKIFDINGKEIKAIVDQYLTTGHHTAKWDGSAFSSGLYYYQLKVDKYIETKRLLLIK